MAAERHHPDCRPSGQASFAAVTAAVLSGRADRGVLPVRNTIVGEIHDSLATIAAASELEVIDTLDVRVVHCLLALPGADLGTLKWAESHPVALAQCARWLSAHRLTPRTVEDTAGAARDIAADRDWTRAAIAPHGAAERYGLIVLEQDIGDALDNWTSFAVIVRRSRASVAA